ncbi:MAG: hypothetical protein ACRDMW_07735 [Gaiellaceae bacterium]
MLALALVLALAACGGGEESAPTTSAEAPSAAFAAAGCPIDDPAACERAALAATAVEEGDTAALVELSYADTFVCDDLPAEMFPDCAPGETLEGHAVTGADGKIGILSAEDYAARLAELGEVTVAGVGTCGPEDPDRRSYHLAFWTADGAGGGSLELVRREGEWSIGIVYADSLANWKTVYSDPETELACGNVQPWD